MSGTVDIICRACLTKRFPLGLTYQASSSSGPCAACGADSRGEFYIADWDGPRLSPVDVTLSIKVRLPMFVGDSESSCWIVDRSSECPFLDFDASYYLRCQSSKTGGGEPTCRAFKASPVVSGDRVLRSLECLEASAQTKP